MNISTKQNKPKTFKLIVHQKTFNDDEVIVNQRDLPDCNIGDVIEIYSPEDEFSRLLLQIKSFPDEREVQHKDKPTISVEQSVATTFQLRSYGDVLVNKVDKQIITLDSVEVTFKDQYLARSDMWRTRCSLVDRVVYLNKKFDYPSLRFQIFEMWNKGEKVASGYITKDTKIVFRSASSMVYLFVQMSSEMWDFDINGDLYFEKAINGFICGLFDKWRRFNCNHDVTIVLFSRTFYEASSIEEFSEEMRDCLQQDHRKRFYEDFYRIAVQNERYDEWNSTIILLKKLFNTYQNDVLRYHERWGKPIPKARNSNASQGNILEVLNMSLNVFEKHYMDRSFDRTGQSSVIITPGDGVFNVDYDLTKITKQRIIDNGIGSDLVCLQEQPLHVVPTFQYNPRPGQNPNDPTVYYMPHWINLSFFVTRKPYRISSFIPRIKKPEIFSGTPINRFDFVLPTEPSPVASLVPTPNIFQGDVYLDEDDNDDQASVSTLNDMSEPCSSSVLSAKKSIRSREDLLSSDKSSKTGKNKKPFNPFQPNQIPIKVSSSRRRWTHVFPLGTDGFYIQQHNYNLLPLNTACTLMPINCNSLSSKKLSVSNNDMDAVTDPARSSEHLASDKGSQVKSSISSASSLFADQEWSPSLTIGVDWKSLIIPACLPLTTDFLPDQRTVEKNFLDSEYTLIPEDQGADLADRKCYRDEDYHNHLPLGAPQVFQEFICQRLQQGFQIISSPSQNATTPPETSAPNQISQICVSTTEPKSIKMNISTGTMNSMSKSSSFLRSLNTSSNTSSGSSATTSSASGSTPNTSIISFLDKSYTLSIGHMFHKLEMDNFAIKVKICRPRVARQIFKIHYCYQFRAPDNDSYGVSWVDFSNEKVENYNWNYLDNYICLRGDEEEYELRENLKFWRLRLLLLPSMQSQTKQILESITTNKPDFHCDIYNSIALNEKLKLQEGFLKFFEIINRIRRQVMISKKNMAHKDLGATNRPHDPIGRRYSSGVSSISYRTSGSVGGVSGNVSDSTFRERLGSSVLHDRPKGKNLFKTRDELEPISAWPTNLDAETTKSASDTGFGTAVEATPVVKKLNPNQLQTLMEAIKSQPTGLHFLPQPSTWSQQTFISAEAVNWAMEHVDGITNEVQASSLFQRLLDSRYICHASGDYAYPFKFGFYLYFVVNRNVRLSDERADLEIYKREWFEVELSPCRYNLSAGASGKAAVPIEPPPPPVKHSLLNFKNPLSSSKSSAASANRLVEPNVNKQTFKGTSYYKSMLDIDSGLKSGRTEWVHIRYQQLYDPAQAFEIVLEWMVATSNQIADIVQGWARKAGLTGLHLVPIPSDPFALPFSSKSDPLRSPIYVPLNFDCLPPSATEQLLNSSDLLLEFRIEILTRFGFLPFLGGLKENQKQYVHVSGSIFVLIPIPSSKCKLKKENSRTHSLDEEGTTPHEIYVSRHFSGLKQNKKGIESVRRGFLWSWNYMISKRWKTHTTGDETFQRKVLKDFRLFCSNNQNRLVDFWQSFESKSLNKSQES